ncbi:YopX family protein [Streptococcus suis]
MIPKYRVWVEAEETMHPVLGLDWSGVGDDLTAFVPMGKTSLRAVSIDSAVLMQSTGLFDKNAKEIFEGDVVKVFDDKLSKIYYSDGAFCVDILNGGTPLHAFLSEHLEVIGNVHQNPELLEVLDEN